MTWKNSKVNPKILKLTGDNFEIGRGLGKFWGDYFYDLNKRKRNKRDKDHYDYYEKWLKNDAIDERIVGLLRNMGKHFPELFHELVGMYIGINQSQIRFKVSLYGLFRCWLAESDESFKGYNDGCSSVILPTKNGFCLAHSDENKKTFPLVLADVSLETADNTLQFISISHPFQLLGSAAGMNRNFAFQGNSIGCNRKIFDNLLKDWHTRIPKTVFSRMMLEMSSIDEIKELYQNHGATLPNHHYVVFCDKAYSIEVKPSANEELIVQELRDDWPRIHTNHFLNDHSRQWVYYKGKKESPESRERRAALKDTMQDVESSNQVKAKFEKYLKEYIQDGEKLIDRTSGAFFFTIQQGEPLSCEGYLYYGGTPFSVSTN